MTAALPWSLLLPVLAVPGGAGQQPPHILVLLADDLGFNDVSWHNEVLPRIESSSKCRTPISNTRLPQHVLTPHLASLAGAGLRLEQHYSQPICSPTRAALLTGRYPVHTGLLIQYMVYGVMSLLQACTTESSHP